MSLPRFSIRRPVTTVMLYTGILLLGVIAWTRLPQELYPPITYPQLTIATRYKDAAPEEIELLVTKPIEEVVGTVSGVRRISSISKEELSLVIAEFNWGTNMDFAALGVREKIDLIKERLPRGSEDPVVIKYNPFQLPVIVLNLSGGMAPNDLLELARKQIKNELEKVEGVAAVNISGGLEREILVEVDQGRLQASRIPISQVTDAISKANLNYPAGTIKEAFYEYLIRTMGEFKVVPEMGGIAVGMDEGKGKGARKGDSGDRPAPLKREKGISSSQRMMMLKDIATVRDTFRERSSVSRFNRKENISLSVQKQAGANTIRVAGKIKEVIDRLMPLLPPGVQLTSAYDQSVFIRQSIDGVRDAALEGGVLAFLVLFLFLGNFWAALNVTFAIPIAALATIGPMYFSGITINIISMGGLALAIGMLVDAGTVTVENIDLKRAEGMPSKQAAVEGTEEVSGALFGTVNTTVVVFLPMVFVVGIVGQMFKDLAYTVTLSNYASLLVALTLTPLFASRLRYTSGTAWIEPAVNRMRRVDTVIVTWFLRHRFFAVIVIVALFVLSIFAFFKLDKEMFPRADQGQFILRMNLPPGTRLEATDKIAQRIEKVLFDVPEVKDVTVTIGSSKEKRGEELLQTLGSHQAQILVNLKPRYLGWGRAVHSEEFRLRKTDQVVQELKDNLQAQPLEGADIEYVLQDASLSSFVASAPLVVEVKGANLLKLEQLSEEVKKGLEKIPGLYGVQTSLIPPSPETKVHVLKDRASTYHLSVSDIALTSQTAVKGFVASKFKQEGKEIDIRVRLRKKDREDFNKVRRLLIHSPLDIDVPLAEVAYFSRGKGPTEIRHLDQQRTILVSARSSGVSSNEMIKQVEQMIARIKVPSAYNVALTGESQQIQESFRSLAFALGLAVLLVYMVMASEFESLWQPLLIMGTIPMGIIGVVLILWLTHTPVSSMVYMGIIILGGLVVDDGIVLVDYINLVRRQGVPLEEAAVLASERRLRPILMTSATTVLGLLPLAFGLGEGTELQRPMAISVMGGMTVCTFLTLFFLPSIYCMGARFFEQFRFHAAEEIIPSPAVPDVPEGFGGEEAVPEGQSFPFIFTAESVGKPEPPVVEPSPFVPPAPAQPSAGTPPLSLPESVFEESPPIIVPPSPPSVTPPSLPPIAPASSPTLPPLNIRQQMVLDYLKTHDRITRLEYVQLTGASIPTAARDLKELTDQGVIQGIGPLARGRYYVLVVK